MNRIIISIVFLFFTSVSYAEPVTQIPVRFMGIEWGTDMKMVVKKLKGQKFNLTTKDSNGNYVFIGEMFGDEAGILCVHDNEKVAKIVIMFPIKGDVMENYNKKLKIMTDKYGEPNLSVRQYIFPFEDDTNLELGLMSDKIYIADAFKDKNDNTAVVCFGGKDNGRVAIVYESVEWTVKEFERRDAEKQMF